MAYVTLAVILSVEWSNPTVVASMSAATAFVTTILATPVRYVLDKRTLLHKLRTEYEYEQRRELRQLIGRYHGRLVDAADAWHNRMENIYKHEAEHRLDAHERYADPDYYFGTTVYRFLSLCSLARQFEAEAFFIDARIAEQSDLDFVRFVKAFRWLVTDLGLIEGVEYDAWQARDHLLTDRFRTLCDACVVDGTVFTLSEFEQRAGKDPVLEPALKLFDGLHAGEPRLRWDRLVALHLFVMAFLNVFGYDMQRSHDGDFTRVARHIKLAQVKHNLLAAIETLGLADNPEGQRLARSLASPSSRRRSLRAVARRRRKQPTFAPR